MLAAVVHPASEPDREGARAVLACAQPQTSRVRHLWADAGYTGELVDWVTRRFGWTVEIVKRPKPELGFAVQPRRWVVERTFAWLGRNRRLSKDYEEQPDSSEAWIYLAMGRILTRRLSVN